MGLFRAAAGALAAAVVASTAGAQGLLRDEEIERMLWAFEGPIIDATAETEPTPLRREHVKIYLVGDPTMNAFVTAGQNIFIHTGIITEAEFPNELKGVLAHETGHIVGADLSQAGQMGRAAMGPMLVTMAAGIAAAVAGHGDAAAGLLASSPYFGQLSAATYSRGQESQADRKGAELLEASGQSVRGLITFFDRFRWQEVTTGQRLTPYFRTHPLSSDRIDALRNTLETQEHSDVVDTPEEQLMLERAKAKIRGFLDDPRYALANYPETDQSTEALYARAIVYHRTGLLNQSIETLDELIAREPENPYFWELKGQVFFENGRAAMAVEPYEQAVALLPDSALFRIGLAQAILGEGENTFATDDAYVDTALEHLVTALAIEPDNALAWRERSRAHDRRGERALAELATAEQAYYSGDARRSLQFAHRAREDLERGSPEWLRASDIVSTVSAFIEDRDGRRR